METVSGSCHCGDIRYEAQIPIEKVEVIDCNCSMCTKKGFLHLVVSPSHFKLLTSPDAITTYTFNTRTAKHHFCKKCGIAPYYIARSHPNDFDLNARCLDNFYQLKERFVIQPFDGAHWEDNINSLNKDHANQTTSTS